MVQKLSLCFCSVLHSVFRQSFAVCSIQFSGSHQQCAPFNFQAPAVRVIRMRPTRAWSAVTEGELQTNDSGDAMAFEQRRRAVSADLVTSRLRRQPSETSQSSNDLSASHHSVALLWQERRLLLELRGLFAALESFGGRPVWPWTLLCRTPSLSWTTPLVVWRA